jgi:hypothetical protein
MIVEYGTLGFIHEGGIDPTQTCDDGYGSPPTFDYYQKGMRVEYTS